MTYRAMPPFDPFLGDFARYPMHIGMGGGTALASALVEPVSPVRRNRTILSPREHEIVELIAQGFQNKEIAEKMIISIHTVKNHLHHILEKLGLSSRLEVALHEIHENISKLHN
jgi:DNA-binding NarL/FixJ family response regulator